MGGHAARGCEDRRGFGKQGAGIRHACATRPLKEADMQVVLTWAAAWPRERRSRGSRRSTATAEASSSSSAAAAASGEAPPTGGSSAAERRQTAGPVAPRGSWLAGSR